LPGSQKYHCKTCGSYGTLKAVRGYESAFRAQVKRGVLERLSLRGLERMLRVSRRTLSRWLQGWIASLPPLATSLLPAQVGGVLELDEWWSFVGSKEQPRWLWLALCRRTRQVVAYWLGDRNETGALQLWRHIPDDALPQEGTSTAPRSVTVGSLMLTSLTKNDIAWWTSKRAKPLM
jgi:hypothetical protein